MPSFKHKKLIEKIAALDSVPSDPEEFSEWVGADAHLKFLKQDAHSDEIIIYASGPYSFIHSIVVPDKALDEGALDDLLQWSCNPFTSYASYVHGGGRNEMWIERGEHNRGSPALDAGTDLIFGRTFEGWSGSEGSYFEVNQEYTHLSGIHWRPEEQAYCRFDENGDLRHSVSITSRSGLDGVSLVSFKWEELEEYLSVSGFSLVRMFDFTLLKRSKFGGWPDLPEEVVIEDDSFLYRQRHCGSSAYTRGLQIVTARRSARQIQKDVVDGWSGRKNKQYADFLAFDWRNQQVTKISTDPAATTNYFKTEGNNKPFELSPAFFRPEVLSKYKTDREKYIVGDRHITCRSAWHLRGYDVNEAGQIHAYICDLRSLPYAEQLHWLSFNIEPESGISERAFVNDFKGEFVSFSHPREEIMGIVRRWRDRHVDWWKLRNAELLDRANIPLTPSKDEWSDAVMDLAKLVVEGFETKPLRRRLDELSVAYDANQDRTLTMLGKLVNHDRQREGLADLPAMREAQLIRSKVKGHASGTEANEITKAALAKHGSYKDHFTDLCARIAAELLAIELHFEGSDVRG